LNDTFFSANITIDTTIIRAGNFVLKLIIFDSATCKQTDTTFYEFTTEDFADANFILERDSCSLEVKFVNQSSNLSTPFIWNFGDGDTSTEVHPKHQYTSTNTYTITLIANNGSLCADTMIKNFYIDGDTSTMIRAANVFTPNNDGLNDCYSIDGVHEKCDEFHIWIRNRWGNLFFESTNPKQCWDGKNEKGEEASAGVYYYIVQIKKRSGKVYNTNGTIQLIR
jgi:gliding motility-associated-like protein